MAATDPQLYSVIYVLADSALLSEEASVSLTRESGSSPSKTVAKGYAGETPGSPMCELEVSNMVPAAGLELDVGKYIQTMTPIEIGLLSHGKQLIFRGFVVQDSLKHSVDSESTYDFTVRGSFAPWE